MMRGSLWASLNLWKPSAVAELLEDESTTLEELLDEDELLQEANTGNEQLDAFLCKPDTLEELIKLLTVAADEDASPQRRIKFPYLVSELVLCDLPRMRSGLATKENLGRLFGIFGGEVEPSVRQIGLVEKVRGRGRRRLARGV